MLEPVFRGVMRRLISRGRVLGPLWRLNDLWPYSDRLFVARVHGGRISCDLRDAVQRAIWFRQSYEPELSALLRAELRPGDTFLDVGANVGWFTHLGAACVGPTGQAIGFEANPILAHRVNQDLQQSGTTYATVLPLGLGDRDETLGLIPGDDYAPDGSAHLGAGQGIYVVPLDGLRPTCRADVLKLDVEGYEVRALRGMSHLLADTRLRLAVIEAAEENLSRYGHTVAEIEALMQGHGFACEIVRWGDGVPMLVCRRH